MSLVIKNPRKGSGKAAATYLIHIIKSKIDFN